MSKREDVIKAIQEDNLVLFKKLIKEGYDPSISCESFERNALHVAAKFGSVNCLDYLLENNLVAVESVDQMGNTALMSAAINGKLPAIEVLLSYNADTSKENKKGLSAIKLAFEADKTSIVEFFKKRGASANDINDIEELKATRGLTNNPTHVEAPTSNSGAKTEGGSTKAIEVTEEDVANYPGLNQEEIKTMKELISLGFENISEEIKVKGAPVGRAEETAKLASLINKNNNVIVVGDDGVGKTTMMRELAQQLGQDNKILLQVPSSLLRGNRYAGSVNENIQKWVKLAASLHPKVVLFVDEIHNLTTGKTSNDTSDTPTQILKEFLDNVGDTRIQIIGATNYKEYDKLKEADESFVSKFFNGNNGGFEVKDLSKEQIIEILLNEKTIQILKEEGLQINDYEKYKEFVLYSVDLLDDHIFNQKFPYKAFDFIKTVLGYENLESVSKEKINEQFSKKYNVPLELINGYVEKDSIYLSLGDKLKQNLLGQDEVLDTMVQAILKDVAFKNQKSRKPLSFLSLGPTGVGKSESVEVIQKELGIEKHEFKMGEYKSPSDIKKIIEELSEFISKNYSGLIVFDEIEKAHPQVLDVLLGLLDKGRIGSGKNEVSCGNQIFIATSNIGANLTSALKEKIREEFGTTGIPEDYLREILIEKGGMRPEIVNRFSCVLDFNPIYLDTALEIGTKMFEKKQKYILEQKGIDIVIDDSFVRSQIEKNFDEKNNRKNGARGIERIVEKAFEKILTDKEVILNARPGTRIVVSESEGNEIVLKIKPKDGEEYTHTIREEELSKEEKLKRVIEKMKKGVEQAESVLQQSMGATPANV